jgi:27-O-demethylrifamycin SV methyltransferase
MLKQKCTPFGRVIRFVRHFPTLMSMGNAFGRSMLEAPSVYEKLMFETGFSSAYTVDITKETMATPKKWRESLNRKSHMIKAHFGVKQAWRFRRGCDALEYMLANGTYGYGIVRAAK